MILSKTDELWKYSPEICKYFFAKIIEDGYDIETFAKKHNIPKARFKIFFKYDLKNKYLFFDILFSLKKIFKVTDNELINIGKKQDFYTE